MSAMEISLLVVFFNFREAKLPNNLGSPLEWCIKNSPVCVPSKIEEEVEMVITADGSH
jgi:hypothetical protein